MPRAASWDGRSRASRRMTKPRPPRSRRSSRSCRNRGSTSSPAPTGSSQALSSLATTTPAKIIQATYANGAEMGDGTKYPFHYQCTFNTNQQGEIAARYLVENDEAEEKIGILQENTAFGEQATTASRATLKKLGLEPVKVEVSSAERARPQHPTSATCARPASSGHDRLDRQRAQRGDGLQRHEHQKWFLPITGHNGLSSTRCSTWCRRGADQRLRHDVPLADVD